MNLFLKSHYSKLFFVCFSYRLAARGDLHGLRLPSLGTRKFMVSFCRGTLNTNNKSTLKPFKFSILIHNGSFLNV